MQDATLSPAAYSKVFERTDPETLKRFVETLLHRVGPVEVERNDTALASPPGNGAPDCGGREDGVAFVAEACVRVDGVPGRGTCAGGDRSQALAMAILDALLRGGRLLEAIVPFVQTQQERLR